MKVLQLGCGICGLVCAEHLSRNPKVDRLILADAQTVAAQSLADRLKDDRVAVMKVDGTDATVLSSLLKECDIAVATMPWRLNRVVMQTAAKIGTDYVDFGMPFDSTGPEFDEHSKQCRDGGIAALVGMGEEPGMSDVFAMHAASKLDRADEAHIYDGDTASVDGLDFFSTWSPVDLLDETSVPAAVFKDGKIEFIPPLSARQVYEFPPPLGPLPVYKTNHDETYFMPLGIKTLKQASFNIGIDDRFAEAARIFRKWGLLSKELIDVKGSKVKPLDVVAAMLPRPVSFANKVKGDTCFVVEVIGEKDGRKKKVKMWTMMSHAKAQELFRTNAGAFYVGTGGAVATEMLIDGEVKEKGIVIPEQLPIDSFLGRLREKGVEIGEEMTDL
ncbi:MAG: saccharopine dehydrogenase NADP-binding domain-containing protein [Candidatus Thermoplasmatota archaeon]|nr:saccharopine dehydrogenase NADP-binding domain-containing protein [Candidatus Thermoplasmatota archaeon]